MEDIALSLMMLVALALVVGAIARWRREGFVRHVWLMLLAAAVLIANVVIWAIPVNGGAPASDRAASGLH
jgi:hypothetical protein